MLYYVSGIRRFAATATLTSTYREETDEIWKREGSADWLYRINIKPEVVLDEEQYIQAGLLAHRLDYIRRWPPENWYMAFQGNLHLLPKNDFFLIESEMKKLKFGSDFIPDAEPPPEKTKARSRRGRGGSARGGQRGNAGPATANGGVRETSQPAQESEG